MNKARLLKASEWQDLIKYKPWEVIKEISLPIPWFVLEMWAVNNQHYGLMFIAAAFFFLTCLRVSHNAFHYALGLSRQATDLVMLLLSVFMMTSMRATQFTHMQHHRHCLEENDVEGYIAKLGFWQMLLQAPLFTIKLHVEALSKSASSGSGQNSNQNINQNFWIKFEIALNVIWMLAVWFWWDVDALKIHTIIMLLSHAISPVFTVWSVHHDCEDEGSSYHSRTLRSKWLSPLAYNMLFHLEHHTYPAIPTCHLSELADRLDRAGLRNYKTVI